MPTQVDLPQVNYITKNKTRPEKMPGLNPHQVFDSTVVSFLSELSEALRRDKESGQYPDVVTFAFFCRKANLKALEKPYRDLKTKNIGRGVSFHIAPSNVPVIFAYSLMCGLLSGNACIIRLSEKKTPQVDIICKAVDSVLSNEAYKDLRNYITIVRYAHDHDINAYFSSVCDIRVIWGGDKTISEIRKASLPARAFDITFADRYSLSVIHARNYLLLDDKNAIASGFYNDTYLFDQNACSSPRLLVWVGNEEVVEQAKVVFWDHLYRVLDAKAYKNEPIVVVDKLTALCKAAIKLPDVKVEKSRNNIIMRVRVGKIDPALPEFACAGGVFYEYVDTSLDALLKIVDRKYQTMTYIGFDPQELRQTIIERGVSGIDSIVPVGASSQFDFIWDGYDLIRHMSRTVRFI